jgi:hypothetical protein
MAVPTNPTALIILGSALLLALLVCIGVPIAARMRHGLGRAGGIAAVALSAPGIWLGWALLSDHSVW